MKWNDLWEAKTEFQQFGWKHVMTEAEWQTATDPKSLLDYVHEIISDRRCWLFVAACNRRILPHIPDGYVCDETTGFMRIVNLLELHLEGTLPAEEAPNLCPVGLPDYARMHADSDSQNAAMQIAGWAVFKRRFSNRTAERRQAAREAALAAARCAERAVQCDILRCIIGNPFHAATCDPNWLVWNDGTIRRMAQASYDDRAFDRLPILADALEDAGCDNADILTHCRSRGEHVRGCWVVDLLLGKK